MLSTISQLEKLSKLTVKSINTGGSHHLVYEGVSQGSPLPSRAGGLVWYCGEPFIKPRLECVHSHILLVSQVPGDQVEQPGSLDLEGGLPGLPNSTWGVGCHGWDCHQQTSPLILLEWEVISLYKSLGDCSGVYCQVSLV